MRYHNVLLPALAGLALADDPVAVAENPAATPDALPFADLRDIPVPTYSVVVGATSQDIPYATSAAIAEVSSAVAATPLSVIPAATDVPLNAAGLGASGSSDDASSNVIASNLKRALGASRREKRDSCAPQPTIPNTYNVNLDTPASFKADETIARVASAATAPAGYFENFKNLAAANNAMNYLGYSVVKTGYDVDWCAAKCDAKAGCLAFNIYFERDPTLKPGPDCPNPDGFANIKCSYWGTGLDQSTATNVGQWRAKFWVSIAGSNAYTSYKMDGPVAGWNGPEKLGNLALNAPLWDCENKWTYLGYKLLQSGSVDPRLCATACDAQTAFNKAHPQAADPYACNAFGSYILTKTNSTGSYQQGQMCTFYTAYWDAKYAGNKGGFDGAIGATYTFSHSTFYGKQGADLTCPAGFQSPSGTYIKGGVNKKQAIKDASKIISSSSLQPYCSSILGYTAIPASTTFITSTSVSSTTAFETSLTTAQATVTSSQVTTSTTTITTTANQFTKRDATDYDFATPTGSTTINGKVLPALPTVPAWFFSNATSPAKRDISQPSALASYPEDVITSACSAAITQATATPIITSTVLEVNQATVTEIATSTISETSTLVVSATTLVTETATASSCASYNFVVASASRGGYTFSGYTFRKGQFLNVVANAAVYTYIWPNNFVGAAATKWSFLEDGTIADSSNRYRWVSFTNNLNFVMAMTDEGYKTYNQLSHIKCSVDTSKTLTDIQGAVGVLSCVDEAGPFDILDCSYNRLPYLMRGQKVALGSLCSALTIAAVPAC